jgi:hypothetical protein
MKTLLVEITDRDGEEVSNHVLCEDCAHQFEQFYNRTDYNVDSAEIMSEAECEECMDCEVKS